MPANTGEDAQPNEIRLSRKGAGVPPIRSSNVSAGSRGRGRGRGWRGPFNIQRPSKQPAVSSYRASPMQEQAEEDSRTPRSPVEHAIPAFHHKRPRKRRRIEDKNDASHAPGKQISTSSSSNQFHATRKEKPNKEYVDFSVHLPHSCRKGAPNCNKFRQDWINKNKKMLQKQHGLRFIQYMICDESIFFTFLKNSSGCPVAEGGNVANVSTDPISLATGLHRTSSEETHTQGDGDVAGSTIVNVTGHGLREEVCHSEHASVLLDPNLSLQEEIIDLTGDSDDIAGRGQDVGLYGDTTSAIEDSVGDISRERGVQCLGSKRESPATLLSTSKWESKKLRIQLLSPTDDPTSSSDFSSPNAPPQGVVHAQMPYVLSNVTARGVPAAPALGERVHHSSRGLERETGRKRLLLPKHRHDKPRRLMFSRSLNSGPVMFYAVTMHGFLYSVPAFQCV
ncbi:hypothetical protein NEOLEDRAFT_183367 [Neolentinus lepideus HHB14362 ss-1]|uniref:Uncharacterized protein n=1 Tax=Neolentinus lepideus HHB14362 ss-1 TaxID=1314782 RepID=A0A165TPC1_9AGAM|nr:hypothetical protein NEOLEDRAFT_183367 [Neolentinus lepideus HHB14362 ss-1]